MDDHVSAPQQLQLRMSDTGDPAQKPAGFDGTGAGGARYKLMSPAKLPISRSSCITIPPGLSPTSFLESPVLLSNVKAEPSPTTGSLTKPQMPHASVGSSSYLATSFEERKSSSFEFRPPPKSNMAPADFNHQRSEQTVHVQGTGAPPEVDSDELNQQGHPNAGVLAIQSDNRGNTHSMPSDDGYNWRKYGQKHVKGSEFPRSYYKCTHPNCEVKKLFERSHDGQITEIIYKGTHDHPKPQPSRRYSAGMIMSNQEERSDKASSLAGRDDKSSMYGQVSHTGEPNGTPDLSPGAANDENGEGAVLNRINDEFDEEDPFSKRRKMDGGIEVTPVVKPIREPRVVVQTLSEVDILDDGYRWRKYGQKVVRGNPNPRSYYKCTNAGCPVRKHVERASHDPKAVITTYEGKHNHDVPTARTSSHDTSGVALNGASRLRPEENDAISLDLGVGISSGNDNRLSEQQQVHAELIQGQTRANTAASFRLVPAVPLASYYGVVNSGLNSHMSREPQTEVRSVELQPLNHSSYPYPPNMGRILSGP